MAAGGLRDCSAALWPCGAVGPRPRPGRRLRQSLLRRCALTRWFDAAVGGALAQPRRAPAPKSPTVSSALAIACSSGGQTSADGESSELDWKDQLIERLLAMPPDAFERLARRLLREAGFVSATVTGRSGDGGIDGIGVYRLSLLSFPVFFQCKRYRGSVRASAVRDFRGAMAGRGDKGLLITTGSFTREAKDEATRDGAPPIDLIDGDRLCDLLKEQGLGVKVTTRTIEDVGIEGAFFSDI